MCAGMFVCKSWVEGERRCFSWRGASVTAINVTNLQTPYFALREVCGCNLVTSEDFVVQSSSMTTSE